MGEIQRYLDQFTYPISAESCALLSLDLPGVVIACVHGGGAACTKWFTFPTWHPWEMFQVVVA